MIRTGRWQLTMSLTLVATLGSLFAVWQVADARSFRCLQAPHCTPPPCDYFRQLEMWSALKAVHEDARLRAKMRADAHRASPGLTGPALEEAAANLLHEEVQRQSQPGGAIARRVRECAGSPISAPPGLTTTSDCRTVDTAAPSESLSRERAHERYDTCSEFINAIFDHEDVHMDRCSGPHRMNSTERAHMGIDTYAAEEAAGYDAAVRRAKSGLTWWAATCAKDIDRNTRRELVRQGIALLGGGGR